MFSCLYAAHTFALLATTKSEMIVERSELVQHSVRLYYWMMETLMRTLGDTAIVGLKNLLLELDCFYLSADFLLKIPLDKKTLLQLLQLGSTLAPLDIPAYVLPRL